MTDKDEGRFYCNWCGEMKPIEERREITDKSEYLIWVGCVACHKKKPKNHPYQRTHFRTEG